jgi:hypothetical protein
MKLYDSGPEAVQSASLVGNHHPGKLLPPLFSEIKGAGALSAGTHYGYLTNSQTSPAVPAQIFYFLRNDGQLVVTNDLSTIDDRRGRVISAEQARCVLRGKASPCDNAPRW